MMPKLIPGRAHLLVDCAAIASFFLAGIRYWRRNKPAAMAACLCGTAAAANTLLTSYPRGNSGIYHLPMHGKIEYGIAAMSAVMPELMSFQNEPEKAFFVTQGALMIAAANLTNFGRKRKDLRRSSRTA
ncbi:MAG: hypothetical protein DMG90_13455 [Acidobacteria bacterium]|jgi:hypothetical protein|nr:MAG: hypothetical protein DMG91_12730 [Acidobacteriota bacterium]PYV88807.1 MAG: hypothetical protein DMG90_13455 [Acidobacteriota bacterium]